MTDQRVSVHPDFQRNSWLRIAPTWRHATDIVSKFDEPSPPRGFAFAFFWKVQNTKPDDNDLCAGVVYSETRCKAARRLAENSSHCFAILGGYVSRASYARGTGYSDLCPSCQVVSSCNQEFWTCPSVPNPEQRPPKPECPLQARLCWPTTENNNGDAILAWQCQVRKFQLSHRYKPPTPGS